MDLKEDDIVLCIVKKVEGTTVFVDISSSNKKGTIVFSEVSAGRIRNLRDFVSPNKKIVCKVLKIHQDHAELSLRRVTAKESSLALERHKKETTFKKLLSSISKDSEKIIEKISASHDLSDFIEEARESPALLSKFMTLSVSTKISKILSEKSTSTKTVKKIFILKSLSASGLLDIKSALSNIKDVKVSYLGSSKFSLTVSAPEFKEAESIALSALEEIEKKAKAKSLSFILKDKK
tara:strand:+ start:1030 stop:1737 length:708 start_codon:yes stop_codon:yes gene_type:complete